eukprot:15325700-Ditylum_brightwellii.AAC.1
MELKSMVNSDKWLLKGFKKDTSKNDKLELPKSYTVAFIADIGRLEQTLTAMMSQGDKSKTKTLGKNDEKETPWYLVPTTPGESCKKHYGMRHYWCTYCKLSSWQCHKPGKESKKFKEHCKRKKSGKTVAD